MDGHKQAIENLSPKDFAAYISNQIELLPDMSAHIALGDDFDLVYSSIVVRRERQRIEIKLLYTDVTRQYYGGDYAMIKATRESPDKPRKVTVSGLISDTEKSKFFDNNTYLAKVDPGMYSVIQDIVERLMTIAGLDF